MKTGAQRVYSRSSEKRGYPWEELAAPPAPESTDAESDVVVIGGGIAGLAAAARCGEAGLSVTLLEAADEAEVSADDWIGALDSELMKKTGAEIAKAEFIRDWQSFCHGRANEALFWQFMRCSGAAVDWLCSLLGARGEAVLLKAGYRGADGSNCGGDHLQRSKADSGLPAYGGELICALLKEAIADHGGVLRFRTRAISLQTADCGAVTGVLAADADGKVRLYPAKKAVVLAAGDILGSEGWMEAFCAAGLRFAAGDAGGKGEAHTLAYRADASFEYPQWAMDLRNRAYTRMTLPFLFVNRMGKRFMNEDTWEQAKAVRCGMQPGGAYAWTVFDARLRSELDAVYEICGISAPLPNCAERGEALAALEKDLLCALQDGNAVQADSIPELAEKMGVPADALEATVSRYNENAAAGVDRDFGKRSVLLTEIRKPPYFAAKWGPELKGVCGGIRVDGTMRVLRADGSVIPGLYANGSATAGIFELYVPPLMEGAVNAQALTGAMALAEDIAREA